METPGRNYYSSTTIRVAYRTNEGALTSSALSAAQLPCEIFRMNQSHRSSVDLAIQRWKLVLLSASDVEPMPALES